MPRKIDKADAVPLKQKVAYGIGGMTENLGASITQNMFNPIYNIALGISPAILGVALMIFRFWDAIADPVMGNISDNARTRFGRRKPFIVIGGILTGICFPLLWQAQPTWSEPVIIAYCITAGLLFYTSFTIWAMPYYSLGMEMTPDYDERTRVIAFRAFFSKFTGLISGWLLALISLPFFSSKIDGAPDILKGMQFAGWIIGGVIISVAILPGIFATERYYKKDASKQQKVPLIKSLKETIKCKPYAIIIAIVVIQTLGYSLVGSLGLYLNIYYVNAGDLQAASLIEGLKATAKFLPSLLSVPLWAWLTERIGKTRALGLTLILGMAANCMIYFAYTPDHPYLQIVPHILMSAFGFGLWMIVPSMQADIVDYDELQSGQRREGAYSAVFSWALKMSGTISAGIGGMVIVLSGFDIKKYGGDQPQHVLETMLVWYAFLPLFFCGVALFLLRAYPLDRQRMHEIRGELEARRGRI